MKAKKSLCQMIGLSLIILFASACAAAPVAAPTASVPTAVAIAATPVRPTPTAITPTPTLVAPTLPPMGDLKLTLLYDNTAFDSRLKSGGGFAALIEYGGHTLLFDTGPDVPGLLDNMKQLGVDPRSIEAVVLSHEHADHTGGLQPLLDTGSHPTVYLPSAFSSAFKEHVSAQTKLVEVTDALEIFPAVHTTRPLVFGAGSAEQALVAETRDGSVVIIGCAHPGLVEMIREAQAVVPGRIALLAGGFHLGQTTSNVEKLPTIIGEVRQLGVEKVLPAHCTGLAATELFRTEYGENCIEGGAGRTVTLPGEKLD